MNRKFLIIAAGAAFAFLIVAWVFIKFSSPHLPTTVAHKATPLPTASAAPSEVGLPGAPATPPPAAAAVSADAAAMMPPPPSMSPPPAAAAGAQTVGVAPPAPAAVVQVADSHAPPVPPPPPAPATGPDTANIGVDPNPLAALQGGLNPPSGGAAQSKGMDGSDGHPGSSAVDSMTPPTDGDRSVLGWVVAKVQAIFGRVDTLDKQVQDLKQELAKRDRQGVARVASDEAPPSKGKRVAAGSTTDSAAEQEAIRDAAFHVTHQPLQQRDGVVLATLFYAEHSVPTFALKSRGSKQFLLTIPNSASMSAPPRAKGLLARVQLQRDGKDRTFVYTTRSVADAALLSRPGSIVIAFSSGSGNVSTADTSDAEELPKVYASAGPLRQDETRGREEYASAPAARIPAVVSAGRSSAWTIQAMSSNSAILYNPQTGDMRAVFVGTPVDGYGLVTDLRPERHLVVTERGSIGG